MTLPSSSPLSDADLADDRKSLIEYPSAFPIKVMGLCADGFVHAMTEVAERFDPCFDASTISTPPASQGIFRPTPSQKFADRNQNLVPEGGANRTDWLRSGVKPWRFNCASNCATE